MSNKSLNINDLLEGSEFRPLDKAISNTLYGHKHNNKLPPLESSKDQVGYTFFVKPQLNMTENNLQNVRQFSGLLTDVDISVSNYIRATLDPRISWGINHKLYKYEKVVSPLVDIHNPFIPALSNTMMDISGWPDFAAPTWASTPGIRKEQVSLIDGSMDVYDAFDLDVKFMNFKNEPIKQLFLTWIRYATLLFEYKVSSYHDLTLSDEADYNTSIYRLIMDESGRYIKKIAKTGAAYPYAIATGGDFDADHSVPYPDTNKEMSVKFKSLGAFMYDDIAIRCFNQNILEFNPSMLQMVLGNSSDMVKIPHELIRLFENRGIPYINVNTNELEWYISSNSPTYKNIINTGDSVIDDMLGNGLITNDGTLPTIEF